MVRARQPGMDVQWLGARAESGATDAQWGRADVLVKSNRHHPNVVVNEYICNRLAIALGIPVPTGDIWIDEIGHPHWVVAAIREQGVDLPPPSTSQLQLIPEQLRATMLCFDSLVLNDDRHDENILVNSSGRAWLIDHDQALFGQEVRDRVGVLRRRRTQAWQDVSRVWKSAPPSGGAVETAARRLHTMSVEVVEEAGRYLNHHSRNLMTKEDVSAVCQVIRWRRDNIRQLIDRSAIHQPDLGTLGDGSLWDAGGEID